jgi:hypothetical protein
MNDADDAARDNGIVAASNASRLCPHLQDAGKSRRHCLVHAEHSFALVWAQQTDFAERGKFRLGRIEYSRHEVRNNLDGAAVELRDLTQLSRHDFRGSQIDLKHQILAVLHVVVQ